jgi:hypothetical protein
VQRFRDDVPPAGLRERLRRIHLRSSAGVMALRTVAVDQAIRDAGSPPG